MNSLERIKNTIAGHPVDRPASAPAYLDLYLDERIHRLYNRAYERKLGAAQSCPIDPLEDARFRVEAVSGAYAIFKQKPDWMHVPYGETRAWAEEGRIERRGGALFYVNQATGEAYDLFEEREVDCPLSTRYLRRSGSGIDNWDEPGSIKGVEDVERDVQVRAAEQLEEEGLFEPARLMAETYGQTTYLRCECGTPYWHTFNVLGFMRMMTAMRKEPALFLEITARKHAQRIEILKGFQRAGVHGVWVEESLSSADLVSERDYLAFAYPTTLAFLEEIRRLGLDRIFYYTGDSMPRLKYLRTLPISALALEESKKGFTVELEKVISHVDGTCAVFGNVDAVGVVAEGSRADIYKEARRQVKLGRLARGFALSQGSPFPLDTPPENIDWLFEARRVGW
jgi:uroporphyrinogen-III decarboxylase